MIRIVLLALCPYFEPFHAVDVIELRLLSGFFAYHSPLLPFARVPTPYLFLAFL